MKPYTRITGLALSVAGMVLAGASFGSLEAEEPAGKPGAGVQLGPKQTIERKVKLMTGPSVYLDDEGSLAAVWVEEEQERRTVFYARSLTANGPLGAPVHVNRQDEAPYWRQEAPALAVRGNDVYVTWALTHPNATPAQPFSSQLRLSRSEDGGRTFLPSILVNDDAAVANHSFDSLHVADDGVVHMAWIDPREGAKDPATFIAKSLDRGRSVGKNLKIDGDTCVCCRTAVTTAPDGALYVAWRKIFSGDVRETVVARSTDGGAIFSNPVIVGHDRWAFPGCPHRPASLGVDGQGRLYVSWYTEGDDETPAVYLAFSDDHGQTFSPKQMLNVSRGTFPDHPQMAVDRDGRIIAVWEEQSPVRREIVMRVSLDRGRTFGPPQKLNEKKGQGPTVAVNRRGTAALAWLEHAMPGHRLVVQTLRLPQVVASDMRTVSEAMR